MTKYIKCGFGCDPAACYICGYSPAGHDVDMNCPPNWKPLPVDIAAHGVKPLTEKAFYDLGKGSRDPEIVAMEKEMSPIQKMTSSPAYEHFLKEIELVMESNKSIVEAAEWGINNGSVGSMQRFFARGQIAAIKGVNNRLADAIKGVKASLSALEKHNFHKGK